MWKAQLLESIARRIFYRFRKTFLKALLFDLERPFLAFITFLERPGPPGAAHPGQRTKRFFFVQSQEIPQPDPWGWPHREKQFRITRRIKKSKNINNLSEKKSSEKSSAKFFGPIFFGKQSKMTKNRIFAKIEKFEIVITGFVLKNRILRFSKFFAEYFLEEIFRT